MTDNKGTSPPPWQEFATPEPRDPTRIAVSSIRGYVSQIVWTVERWVSLGPDEVLVVEGNEDVDVFRVTEKGVVLPTIEEQFKDLEGNITARSEDVYGTIRNFIVAFTHHHKKGHCPRLVFTTTASAGRQRLEKPTGSSWSPAIDILGTWQGVQDGEPDPRDKAEKIGAPLDGLSKDILSLMRHYFPEPAAATTDDKMPRARLTWQELDEALAYIEARSLWSKFILSVEWALDIDDHHKRRTAVSAALNARKDLQLPTHVVSHLPLVHRLEKHVLELATRSAASERTLTRFNLREVALDHWRESAVSAHIDLYPGSHADGSPRNIELQAFFAWGSSIEHLPLPQVYCVLTGRDLLSLADTAHQFLTRESRRGIDASAWKTSGIAAVVKSDRRMSKLVDLLKGLDFDAYVALGTEAPAGVEDASRVAINAVWPSYAQPRWPVKFCWVQQDWPLGSPDDFMMRVLETCSSRPGRDLIESPGPEAACPLTNAGRQPAHYLYPLLHQLTSLLAGVACWRFFVGPEPTNPWAAAFDELRNHFRLVSVMNPPTYFTAKNPLP